MYGNDLFIPPQQQKFAFAQDEVWMHLPEKERAETLKLLTQLMQSVVQNQERIVDERKD